MILAPATCSRAHPGSPAVLRRVGVGDRARHPRGVPEGDTIARLAARIEAGFAGAPVRSSVFRHPRLALADLTGARVLGTSSHGKHLFVHFDDLQTLHVHLLMDGRVRLGAVPSVERDRRRFELHFDGGVITGVDIPLLHLVPTARVGTFTDHLGPDVCGVFDPDVAVDRLRSAGPTALSAAVLDQRIVAGFGNIYAVEVPFICGLSPFTPVASIDGLDSLMAVGTALIRTNAQLGPQNTTGHRLDTGDHFVLDARNRRCPVCGSPVQRVPGSRSPWRRRTAWCDTCQAEDHHRVDGARAQRLLALHPARRMLEFSAVDGSDDTPDAQEVTLTADVAVRVTPRQR
jgi:endonuclease-8